MDLLALADFNLVARHGGFGRAARAAGRPKATLSRRVAELEAALDLRLFERGGRTLRLTEEGRALHARTAALLAELDEAAGAIAAGGDRPRGRLRISAPLLFSQTAMGRLAASFALKFPDVRLEVTTEDRPVDMVEEGYDLVIRVNPPEGAGLVGRVFLRDRLVLVASPALPRPAPPLPVPVVVRGAPEPGSEADTRAQPAHWTLSAPEGRPGQAVTGGSAVAGAGAAAVTVPVQPVLRLSSLLMVRDAVRLGVGAGALPISLVSHDIAAGRLAHWGDIAASDIALWALYPSRRLLSPRVSAFLEHLRAAFPTGAPEELAGYLEG